MKKKVVVILMAGTLLLGGVAAGAARAADSNKALTTQATRMDRYATSKGQTTVTNRTAADFSSFYGEENSQALASGLRSGKEITLTSQATDGSISTTTFTPPTGKMGNGEAYISMALAKQQLTAAGITNPTAQQTQAAMMGGTLTSDGQQTQGVLQMRASGMGWGQIAQAYGTKLGPVISSMKTANTALSRTSAIKTGTTTTGTTTTSGATTTTTGHGKSGIVTGAGGSGGKSGIVTGAGGGANVVGGKGSGGKSGIVTGAGGSGGKSGIVTGAGGAAGGVSSPGAGSHGQGAGIVTGGGGAAGGSGGQGKGYGRGGSK